MAVLSEDPTSPCRPCRKQGDEQHTCVGIEGTGSYGAGLSRWLRSQGLVVVEVDRADRGDRRKRGKDDLIDAENAARAVLSGRASGTPKAGDGNVEMIRVLRVTRRSAMRAKIVAVNQLHALIVAAPDELRERFRGLSAIKRIRKAAALRAGTTIDGVTAATKLALRTLARRYLALLDEISDIDVQLARLVGETAPQLLEQPGIGVQCAAQLLVAAGDNPERTRLAASEAADHPSADRPDCLQDLLEVINRFAGQLADVRHRLDVME